MMNMTKCNEHFKHLCIDIDNDEILALMPTHLLCLMMILLAHPHLHANAAERRPTDLQCQGYVSHFKGIRIYVNHVRHRVERICCSSLVISMFHQAPF